ncbi:MAG TPA: transketolase, partial [Candidatus Dorea intestinavium]|nr:transketolase [Candidatus Dorea intestinavium]
QDDLRKKFTDFGFEVIEVEDGNNLLQLREAFEKAKEIKNKPSLVLANTIKGKGSKVMENKANWHHKLPNEEEVKEIKKDLKNKREALENE